MKNLEKETYVVPNEKPLKLVIHSAKVLGSRYGHIMRTTLPDEAYMQVKDIIYRDYTRLNMKLIDEYELNLYFMCNNIILPSSKIEEIPIDKLQLVIDKMSIIIKELDDSKTVMFDMDDINEFVLECSKMVIRDLKCYGIEVK